ncbi:MAG: type II toxin-antitoxin system YoeB family toxin, partial [Alphaproteobacteria bacterium]|nr:type II toxin-antitoxin system YoeB family toxin [Alphaproteobacteria bacterium]
RKSKTSSALNRLACLIFCKKTSEDLDGNLIISDSQRNEIALKLFLDSDSGDAYYNLAIVKLLSPSGESLVAKKEALTFLMKAALEGIENAATYYEILKNEIEVEQNPFGISDQLVSEIKKEDSILDNMSENEHLQNEEINSANNDSVDDTYEVKSDCDIVKSSNVIENADIKEKIVLSTAESSEQLSKLKRKELKALKKKQREQKKKDLGNKFKKLLRGQLSEQEKTSFISKQKMNIAKKDIKVTFDKNAQKEWVALDVFKRDKVSELIADIKIGGKRGKPEQLVNSDAFSRRITGKHRLIYQIENNDNIKILSCQGHYDD